MTVPICARLPVGVLPRVLWPAPGLTRPCAPCLLGPDDLRAHASLAAAMRRTMAFCAAQGLAAPQVGHDRRLLVTAYDEARVLLNPEVLAAGTATATAPEGCISLPGVTVRVTRPVAVVVAFWDLDGKRQERDLGGRVARAVLHEIDHLDGRTILDHATPAERAVHRHVLRRLRRQHRRDCVCAA